MIGKCWNSTDEECVEYVQYYSNIWEVEETEQVIEDIIVVKIDQTPNMTARIDSIDPLGELIIIFNVSVDIPVMVPLD